MLELESWKDGWPIKKWFAIPCDWDQSTKKGHVVIAWSVNNDFEPSEKLIHRSSDGMEPTYRVSGCGLSINRGRSELYKWYQSRNSMSVESVRTDTNMGNDLGTQRRCCVLWKGWIVHPDLWYMKSLKKIDLIIYVNKVHLLFPSHIY